MFITEIIENYNQNQVMYSREYFHENITEVMTGGRVISVRSQRTFFMTLEWNLANLQIMANQDNICMEILRTLHVGDVIEVRGQLTRSLRGELSLIPQAVMINSRTQHNIELRRDVQSSQPQLRELTLMRNSHNFRLMSQRSEIVQYMRHHMYAENFLELETPMLHENASGASARTFETHCLANNHRYHLRIAPEIYLVRALMSGFNQIFEIGHNFRNEGISNRHQPEFTMMECYRSFADHEWAMNFVESLLNNLGERFNCDILNQQFSRMSYQDALLQYHEDLRVRPELMNDRLWLIERLNQNHERDYENMSLDMLQFQLFESIDNLIMSPTFITNHPIEISPLAQSFENSQQTQRFELFVQGRELGNGFSQLIDLEEQRRRFEMQSNNHEDEAMRTDHVYLESMSYGFPRIGGFGIGIDRLVMLLTQQNDIRDVVLFPIHG